MANTQDKIVIQFKGEKRERRGILRYESKDYYHVATNICNEGWLKENCEVVIYNGFNGSP